MSLSSSASVDAVIACYNESPEAIARTVRSCLEQPAVRHVWVVDDGSPEPAALPAPLDRHESVSIVRRPANGGISAARNDGAARSDAPFLLFINCEIALAPDWVARGLAFLDANPAVGTVGGRVRPVRPGGLVTRWRMHFQENPEAREDRTRELTFATGHAVLMRRSAFQAVGGYDERLKRCREDSDIADRLRAAGYATCQVKGLQAVSHQVDSIRLCASKSLRDSGWTTDPGLVDDRVLRPVAFGAALATETRTLLVNAARNLLSGRLSLLAVDAAVYACSLYLAGTAARRRRARPSRSSHPAAPAPASADPSAATTPALSSPSGAGSRQAGSRRADSREPRSQSTTARSAARG